MIRTIPLDKLVPSTRNVRRLADEQADRELKADIAARGLLQNLVVTSVPRARGRFAVEAGGRRLRALLSLAEEGVIDKDLGVACLVLDRGAEVREASLAENFQRLAMNPADECLAFRQLLEQGADIEGIARRFGVTMRFVEGRLRLAELAPVVFDALGAGEISLDVAKAYAATSDKERQAYVFEQMNLGNGAPHPDSIRRMMTQASASATDRRALFVGEEAYVAAGGRIERDLFADDDAARWLDIALLERLASEKLEALAGETAAARGLAFVRPTLEGWLGHEQTAGLVRAPSHAPPLSDEERARVDELEERIAALAPLLEDEAVEEVERAAAEAEYRAHCDAIEAIVDKEPVVEEGLRERAGTFLMLDERGRPRLCRDFYIEPGDDEEVAFREQQSPDHGDDGPSPARSAGMSQRLVDELAMQRRDILAVHVAADPAFALDLAIFLMIDTDPRHYRETSGSSLAAPAPVDPVRDFTTPGAPATIAQAEAVAALDLGWRDAKTRAERFDAFRALGEEARAAWLGHAVARTLEASLNLAGDRACAFHNHLAGLLGIEPARWWRPTGANYFDRVPKAVTLAALEAVGGPALAQRYAKAKKAELAQACERIFAGDFIAEVDVKEAALAWLPDAMRFASEGAVSMGAGADEEPVSGRDDDPGDGIAALTRGDAGNAVAGEGAEPADGARSSPNANEIEEAA